MSTYLGCHRELFCLFLDIPLGARRTFTRPASAPRKNPASPLTKPWPGCFRLRPALELPSSCPSSLCKACPRGNSIPRFSTSRSARSSERSMPVMKLKSRSKAASLASSLRLRYAAGSRTPEHWDQSLWRRVQGREQVRVEQRGQRYFGGLMWLGRAVVRLE